MFRGDDWLAFSNTVCVVCFNRNYIYLFKYKPRTLCNTFSVFTVEQFP